LLQRATRGTDQAARAEKIERAAERCARIVRNFLAMARQQPPERTRVAINQTVEAALELVAYPLRSDGVEVRTDLRAGLPMLWADGHQLQQVLINLLTNAHHAVRQSDPPRRVTVSTAVDPERQRLVVAVADNGPGIPPEVMPRIFDPFFTTKREGEGTGLGLSLCHGIIEAHGGSLSVESEPGHGAAFRIVLPIEASIAADVSLAKPAERVAQRSRSVLVVDDEPDFLGVLAEMLREEGHEVVAAASGNDALRTATGRSFDLVLSDIRMPELDGPGLYQELVYRNPEMAGRFVFMTGDTLTPATRDFLARTPVVHLAKPFDQQQLREALEKALGGEAGQRSRQR
jgi:two-component system NtrC family sensor kinase